MPGDRHDRRVMTNSEQELVKYAVFAERLADAARTQTLPRFRTGLSITNKAAPSADVTFDPVTDADREAERAQRQIIEETFPDHGILGEEFGETLSASGWRWVLDPVDGTRAFMCGVASWTTLIALERDGAPILGVIDQPFTDERWVSFNGATYYKRGGQCDAVKTSGVSDIAKARLSTTDPLASGYFSGAQAEAFARVASAACVARYSLDAYAYGLLALGALDLVIEAGLQRYDYAALIPVIEGAGGVVTNWRGEAPGADDNGELVAAASVAVHEAALALLAG